MAGEASVSPGIGANIQRPGASASGVVSVVGPVPAALQRSAGRSGRAVSDARHAWVVELIDREGPGVLRMLWRILGREQDVMDAYQDCFCRLAARGRPRKRKSAKAYAYRTAMNSAIEMIRVRSRRGSHWPAIVAQQVTLSSDDSCQNEEVDRFAELQDAVAQLPMHLRNVVVLRDLSRLPYEEVGRTLGIDPATARVYRRHAVVKLAELLGAGGGS